MKKVLLICAMGMSTSVLTEKMNKYAKENGFDYSISAQGLNANLSDCDADVVLIGPQIRFQEKNIKQRLGNKIPVGAIEMADYGTMNVQAILKQVNKLIG
jgi:PTS system cellobiose-specific IIB component